MTDPETESLLFRGKYRIPAARLTAWDYATPGHYFVTICTDDRFPWFGHIEHQRMCVNDIGGIVDSCWRDIPNHFDHVTVDAFVIMPDHVHGIVVIHEKPGVVETPQCGVSTVTTKRYGHQPQWKQGVLGSIIQQFKQTCTKRIRQMGFPDFGWQSRYYDHIMTDADRIERVRNYIRNNPVNYGQDEWWRI